MERTQKVGLSIQRWMDILRVFLDEADLVIDLEDFLARTDLWEVFEEDLRILGWDLATFF